MGATVTVGKSSAALVRADGTVIYALFEKTYEKNCYPHTPHWSCFTFGTYEDVMLRVFRGAACCESGMLQSTGGRYILPENYIAAWQRAIGESSRLPDQPISLKLTGSYRGPITEEKRDATQDALQRIGRSDVFAAIMAGQANIRLYDDLEVVLALYGVGQVYPPWMVLDYSAFLTLPEPAFSPKPRIAKIEPPVIAAYRHELKCGLEQVVCRFGDGSWRALGGTYSAVDYYIAEVVYPLEMKQTGCAKRLIAAFREQCNNAPKLPGEVTVTVTRQPGSLPSWYVEQADKVATHLGLVDATTRAPDTFDCTLSDVIAKGAEYEFFGLKNSQMEWHMLTQAQNVQPAAQLELA